MTDGPRRSTDSAPRRPLPARAERAGREGQAGRAGRAGRAGWAVRVMAAGVVVLLGVLSGYFLAVGYLAEPGRTDTRAHSAIGAGLGLFTGALAALVTWAFVATGRLRSWWLWPPVLLIGAALLRLTVWAPPPYGSPLP
ncbi:hypothetical protein [Streptomyces sp. NPDC048606]|uniref:hypothetical protein n=1 Tax=Streptomyces sp. NPDC048606 TaxID=3154726 RepID=UPI00343CC93B